MSKQISVFEVFKLKDVDREVVDKMDVELLKRKYIAMVPITDKEQIVASKAIATLPSANHMIVDREKYEKAVQSSISKALDTNIRQLKAGADAIVYKTHEKFQTDLTAIRETVMERMGKQHTEMVQYCMESKMDPEKMAMMIQLLEKGKKEVMEVLLAFEQVYRPEAGEKHEETGEMHEG